jgi:hypothetical protein
MTLHYEIEVPEHEPDFVGAWRPVRVFRAEGIAAPLAFESLEEAQAYVAKAAGEARVVLVTDGGGRQVVGPVTT